MPDRNSSALRQDDGPAQSDSGDKSTREKVLESLRADLLAVDLIWSLLVAALNSYRHDTVLRPFPPMFQEGGPSGNKNMKGLEKLACQLPRVPEVVKSISTMEEKLIELLWWSLDKKQFTVKSLDKSHISRIQKLTGHSVEVPTPNYIFEINYSETAEKKFEDFRQGRQLLYAYHGSRVENFHSILHHGLASHMNKTSLYGEGTYLSSELSVSLHYSPGGQGWDHSLLGDRLSCVAVCQMIDDTSVKCQLKEVNAGGSRSTSRTRAPASMGGEVPEKYYVVTNNDMLRVKYLLVYGEKSSTRRSQQQTSWFSRHKFMLLLLLYVAILAAIGLANSRSFQYQLKRILRIR
ncbi:protein mono-ADP-ribosyltransferase PARP16-like [Liolophura sinensis]|uniref:protein mono-ADP-ribosyltransferase PARP16-like n=1 Tax=Liolophura sinensis TaxID=3198878 RepID=UPI0031597903